MGGGPPAPALTRSPRPDPTSHPDPDLNQGRASFTRNSSTPWFWVVTNPVKLGFGMSHRENSTGIDPDTSIPPDVCSADSGNVTGRVWPSRVSLAVALYVLTTPTAGSAPSAIGLVSVSVPVGYVDVSMIRPRNCTSRSLSSLLIVAICTVKSAAVTVVPLIVTSPVITLVRPTAVWFWADRT